MGRRVAERTPERPGTSSAPPKFLGGREWRAGAREGVAEGGAVPCGSRPALLLQAECWHATRAGRVPEPARAHSKEPTLSSTHPKKKLTADAPAARPPGGRGRRARARPRLGRGPAHPLPDGARRRTHSVDVDHVLAAVRAVQVRVAARGGRGGARFFGLPRAHPGTVGNTNSAPLTPPAPRPSSCPSHALRYTKWRYQEARGYSWPEVGFMSVVLLRVCVCV